MKTILSFPGVLRNRTEAGNVPGAENCSLAFRVFTVHLGASCSKPHQLPGFPPWELYCPRGRSAQDMRPRTLGISRQLPGVESSGHRAKLHPCDPTDNTYLSGTLHIPQGLGSLFVSRAPAYPSMGFLCLKGSRTSFVLIQTKNKGLDVLVPIRLDVNTVGTGTNPPQRPRIAQHQLLQEGLGQHSNS